MKTDEKDDVVIGEYGPITVPNKNVTASEPKDSDSSTIDLANSQKKDITETSTPNVIIGEYGPIVIPTTAEGVSPAPTVEPSKEQTTIKKEKEEEKDTVVEETHTRMIDSPDSNEAPAFGDLDEAPDEPPMPVVNLSKTYRKNVGDKKTSAQESTMSLQRHHGTPIRHIVQPDIPGVERPNSDRTREEKLVTPAGVRADDQSDDDEPNPVIESKESVIAKRSLAHLIEAIKQGNIDTQEVPIEVQQEEEEEHEDEPPPPGVSDDTMEEISRPDDGNLQVSSHAAQQGPTTDQYSSMQMQGGPQYPWAGPYHATQMPFHPMHAWQQSYGHGAPYAPQMHASPQHGQWNPNDPRTYHSAWSQSAQYPNQWPPTTNQSSHSDNMHYRPAPYNGPGRAGMTMRPRLPHPTPSSTQSGQVQQAYPASNPGNVQPTQSMYSGTMQPTQTTNVQATHPSYQPIHPYQGIAPQMHPYQGHMQPSHPYQAPVQQPPPPPPPPEPTQSGPQVSDPGKSDVVTATSTQKECAGGITDSNKQATMSAPLSRILAAHQPSANTDPPGGTSAGTSTTHSSKTKASFTAEPSAKAGGVKRPLSPLSIAVADYLSKQPTELSSVEGKTSSTQDTVQDSMPKTQTPEHASKPNPTITQQATPTPNTSLQTTAPVKLQTIAPAKSKLKLARRGNVLAMAFRQERKLKLSKIQSPAMKAAFGTDDSESDKEQMPQGELLRHQSWKRKRSHEEVHIESEPKTKQLAVKNPSEQKRASSSDSKTGTDSDVHKVSLKPLEPKIPESATSLQTKTKPREGQTATIEKDVPTKSTDKSQKWTPVSCDDKRQHTKTDVQPSKSTSQQNPTPSAPSHTSSVHSSQHTKKKPTSTSKGGTSKVVESSPQHLFYVHRSHSKDDKDKEIAKVTNAYTCCVIMHR